LTLTTGERTVRVFFRQKVRDHTVFDLLFFLFTVFLVTIVVVVVVVIEMKRG